jgi:hypothetical protein
VEAEFFWQVTSCGVLFELGSAPLIRGRITTSHANPGTKRPERGSLMAIHSQNG